MNLRSTEKKINGNFTKPGSLRPPLKAPGKPPLTYLNHSNTKPPENDRKIKPNASRLSKASQNINQAKTPLRSKPMMKSKPKLPQPIPVKVEEESEATIRRKRILEWRERFKNMRFYFDGIDPASVTKFKAQIRSLDGTVDQYLSFNITHLVTGNPDAIDVSRHVELDNLDGPDIIFIAKKLDASLWTTTSKKFELNLGLENVLDAVCNPNALQEALHQEKMLGANPSRKEVSNFKQFGGYYLLVEEPSGSYKPVAVKDYDAKYDKENPPWPKLRLHNHSSQTVFARKSHTNDEEEESTDKISEDEENEPPEEEGQAAGDVAASGFFSGSVAQSAQRKLSANPVLAKMVMRVPKENGKRQRDDEDDEEEEEPVMQPRTKRSKKYHVYPMIFQKTGYCENCNAKYEDYATHIRCSRHRKYATNPSNFKILDPIFKSTQRIPVQKSQDVEIGQSSEGDSNNGSEANDSESDSTSDEESEDGDESESESGSGEEEESSSDSDNEIVEETDRQESVEEEAQEVYEFSKDPQNNNHQTSATNLEGRIIEDKPKEETTIEAEESSEADLRSVQDAETESGSEPEDSQISVTPQGSDIADSEAQSIESSNNSDSEDILTLGTTANVPSIPPQAAQSCEQPVSTSQKGIDVNPEYVEDKNQAKECNIADYEPILFDERIDREIVLVLDKLDGDSTEYEARLISGKTVWVTVDRDNLPDVFKRFEMERRFNGKETEEMIVTKQLLSTGSNLSSIPSMIESDSDSDYH